MAASNGVLDLIGSWATAERDNDANALEALLAGDFVGVGPLGFVLDRDQWLVRFRDGLENRAFAVQDLKVRDYGAVAVAVGVLAQQTSYQGHDHSGRFRLTLVAVRPADAGQWRLAHVHIGALQPPPGPPTPAGDDR
jgi:ketosteroid isomerase-like protein